MGRDDVSVYREVFFVKRYGNGVRGKLFVRIYRENNVLRLRGTYLDLRGVSVFFF